MAIRRILEFPDPRLRKVATPVTVFDAALEALADDLLETMYEAEGIGLAATQIDVHKRVLVLDISEQKDSPQIFVNPIFDVVQDELAEYDEGCLSVPGFFETVSRPSAIRLSALNLQGEPFELNAEGLLSTCIQHEIDHLDGKLFVDYLSSLKRQRIRARLEREHRQTA